MVIIVGKRACGWVDAALGAHIETEFVHAWLIPLWPLRSRLVHDRKKTTIPLHLRSVIAGYGRTWAPVLALVMLFGGSAYASELGLGRSMVSTVTWVTLFCGALLSWIPFIGMGIADDVERAARLGYGRVLGVPADPVALGVDLVALARRLETELEPWALARAPGYRDPARRAQARSEWLGQLADENDMGCLCAAVTLARIETHRATGAERQTARSVHRRIARKLVIVNEDAAREVVVGRVDG